MSPRIDELLEAAVNAYEDVIRRSCDLQWALAHALPRGPARSLHVASAGWPSVKVPVLPES